MGSLIRAPKEFWSGVLFLFIGVTFFALSFEFPLLQRRGIGAGMFPAVVSGCLMLIGVVIIARGALLKGDEEEAGHPIAWKALAAVVIGVVLFGVLIRTAGLLIAVPTLMLLVSPASTKFKIIPAVLLAVFMTGFCWLVFTKGLGLPIPVAPWLD
ncbi:tripartite tricarboxylate transporter TctB family protein [Lacibacterium aquatile]|uniref:Tripartite tricarboxylate transporter TctB family protein n=1 Tax=Lacibacterium aquatile TaxID=1168082 RepID=A0ABW5DQH0_9PROT